MCVCVCVCVCVSVCLSVCVRACVFVYIRARAVTHVHASPHVYVFAHKQTNNRTTLSIEARSVSHSASYFYA